MNVTPGFLRIKYLRALATINAKRHNKHLERLSKDEKYVYEIAVKMLTASTSSLDYSPISGKFYAKNGLNLVEIGTNSVRFVNDEHSYSFYYVTSIMEEFMKIYYRRKQITINEYSNHISSKSAVFLENIYVELNKK